MIEKKLSTILLVLVVIAFLLVSYAALAHEAVYNDGLTFSGTAAGTLSDAEFNCAVHGCICKGYDCTIPLCDDAIDTEVCYTTVDTLAFSSVTDMARWLVDNTEDIFCADYNDQWYCKIEYQHKAGLIDYRTDEYDDIGDAMKDAIEFIQKVQ